MGQLNAFHPPDCKDIIESLLERNDVSEEDEACEDEVLEEPRCPKTSKSRNAFEVLRNLTIFNTNGEDYDDN